MVRDFIEHETDMINRIADINVDAAMDPDIGQSVHNLYYSNYAIYPALHDSSQLQHDRDVLRNKLEEDYGINFDDVFRYDEYQEWYDSQ